MSYTWNYYNIVNQLYLKAKKKNRKHSERNGNSGGLRRWRIGIITKGKEGTWGIMRKFYIFTGGTGYTGVYTDQNIQLYTVCLITGKFYLKA